MTNSTYCSLCRNCKSGEYNEPSFYTQVLDHDGNVLLDKTQTKEQHQVIKEDTAWLLTDAMKDVMTSERVCAYFEPEWHRQENPVRQR